MTIGIDASRANRREKTGIEWYAYHLLNAMKGITNHELRIMNSDFLLYTDTALTDALAVLPEHWQEKLLAWPPRKFWTQGRLSLEMLVRAPDLLFIPSHVIPVIHPKRVVLTCHDIGFERRPELYPKAELAYHRWSMRFGVRAATHIIAVSEFTKRELMDLYKIPAEKITVVHHGFYGGGGTFSGHQVSKDTWCPKHKSTTPFVRSPYLLHVGRIEAKKNLVIAIDAFTIARQEKKVPENFQLIFVGRKGYRHEQVYEAARASPFASDIQFFPWIPSEELDTLYRGTSAVLIPSLYEGFGFPLLEALSYDVPVIASNIPALREIGGTFPLYAEPTADAFAAAILSLIERKGKEREREDRKTWLQQFLWENAARETLTVLQNALS